MQQVGGFTQVPPASSTNKTDRHDIFEKLLNTANLNLLYNCNVFVDGIGSAWNIMYGALIPPQIKYVFLSIYHDLLCTTFPFIFILTCNIDI